MPWSGVPSRNVYYYMDDFTPCAAIVYPTFNTPDIQSFSIIMPSSVTQDH